MMTTFLEKEVTVDDKIEHMFDWNMDGPMYSSLIVMAIILCLAIFVGIRAKIAYARKDYLKRPKGIVMYAEWFEEFCERFVHDNMGETGFEGWTAYFMALFAYLFVAFIWGLTGMPSIIDWLAAPLSLSIIMFVLIQFTAIRYQHFHYFHRYIEPFAVFLPVNLITMWSPIISTAMRLFGNCLSGTIIIGLVQWALGKLSGNLFGSMTVLAMNNYVPFWDVSQSYVWTQIFLAPIPMGILNLYFSLFSGGVQTLVFATLNALWISAEKPDPETSPELSSAPRLAPSGE